MAKPNTDPLWRKAASVHIQNITEGSQIGKQVKDLQAIHT